MQEVQLDENVKLLDCHGVVMLKSSENDAAIARNCKRIEKLDDPISPGDSETLPGRILVNIYKVPSFEAVDDSLQKVATVPGRLKKRGIINVYAAARIVLHKWNEGKITYTIRCPRKANNQHYQKPRSLMNMERSSTSNMAEVCLENQEDALQESSNKGDGVEGNDESIGHCQRGYWREKGRSLSRQPNEKLYVTEGSLNQAEKKRRRTKSYPKSMPMDVASGNDENNDDDYEFKVYYVKNRCAVDDGAVEENADPPEPWIA
ncbi:hypothetical protein MLD38_032939 [Melastoma candidum]|uniref:Uncharacterized protein n=1 Tax=Melastoma candidum TaxID=119954 RepID=A0ACB9M6Z3_9MYRT|nr:hypothetical protein MLD38_032939 [Melastoma candidum]